MEWKIIISFILFLLGFTIFLVGGTFIGQAIVNLISKKYQKKEVNNGNFSKTRNKDRGNLQW